MPLKYMMDIFFLPVVLYRATFILEPLSSSLIHDATKMKLAEKDSTRKNKRRRRKRKKKKKNRRTLYPIRKEFYHKKGVVVVRENCKTKREREIKEDSGTEEGDERGTTALALSTTRPVSKTRIGA